MLADKIHYGVSAPCCELVTGAIFEKYLERVREDQKIARFLHPFDIHHSDVCRGSRNTCFGRFEYQAHVAHADEARGTTCRKPSYLDR